MCVREPSGDLTNRALIAWARRSMTGRQPLRLGQPRPGGGRAICASSHPLGGPRIDRADMARESSQLDLWPFFGVHAGGGTPTPKSEHLGIVPIDGHAPRRVHAAEGRASITSGHETRRIAPPTARSAQDANADGSTVCVCASDFGEAPATELRLARGRISLLAGFLSQAFAPAQPAEKGLRAAKFALLRGKPTT